MSTLRITDDAVGYQAGQGGYVRTIHVLNRVREALCEALAPSDTPDSPSTTPGQPSTVAAPHADAVRDAIAAMAAPRLRTSPEPSAAAPPAPREEAPLRVMLLCGADLLASMLQPGVWQEAHLRSILGEYGVVVVGRCVWHADDGVWIVFPLGRAFLCARW